MKFGNSLFIMGMFSKNICLLVCNYLGLTFGWLTDGQFSPGTAVLKVVSLFCINKCLLIYLFIYFVVPRLEVQLEPLHQFFFVMGIFEISVL
jgi:hypothetical protein